MVWLLPEEKEFIDHKADVYHVPMFAGDYNGFLKQPTLFEAYSKVDFAKEEKKLIWDLPGHGKRYATCGNIFYKGCGNTSAHPENKIFVRPHKNNCHRKECPECNKSWASKGALKALYRHATYHIGSHNVKSIIVQNKRMFESHPRKVLTEALIKDLEDAIKEKTKRKRLQKCVHFMLSPPNGLYSGRSFDDYRDLRKKMMILAKRAGVIGADVLIHPYRLKCSNCGKAIPDYHKHCECGIDRRKEWFWSPHFHLVGYGWMRLSKEIFEETGWIVKNLGIRKSIFHTHLYLLSHSGVAKGVHTLTWFGVMGYRSKEMDGCPTPQIVREKCPYCNEYLRGIEFIPLDRPPPEYDEDALKEDPYAMDLLLNSVDWRSLA